MTGGPGTDWQPSDDVALVAACLDGDAAAWECLVDRYGRLVYAILRRGGLAEADADDAFQNVFLIAYRHLGQLRERERLSSWLITTAKRELWRVGKRRGDAVELDEATADERVAVEDDVVRWDRDRLVRDAMGRLDPRCQDLLISLFLEPAEPRYREIAARLGIAVGSIGPTRARCFRKLEALLVEVGIDRDTSP